VEGWAYLERTIVAFVALDQRELECELVVEPRRRDSSEDRQIRVQSSDLSISEV
jgi:hypothetical protein